MRPTLPGSRRWFARPGLLLLSIVAFHSTASARDDVFRWTPASGPVVVYVVWLFAWPCDGYSFAIGVAFEPEFAVRDAQLWEPFCIAVEPWSYDQKPGPMSEVSDVRGEPPPPVGPRPPPDPVPEPGRLPMLLAGLALLAMLGGRRRGV